MDSRPNPPLVPEPDDREWTWQERDFLKRLCEARSDTETGIKAQFMDNSNSNIYNLDVHFHQWITEGVWVAFYNGRGPDPRADKETSDGG